MTEQDAREALRERLAEARCGECRHYADEHVDGVCRYLEACGIEGDPCDAPLEHALLPAVEEYAAERAEVAEAKVVRVEALAEEMAGYTFPAAAPHYAGRIRAALDGSPAGSGGEEAEREAALRELAPDRYTVEDF